MSDSQAFGDPLGMGYIRVGINELPLGEGGEGLFEDGVGFKDFSDWDVVNKGHKILHVHVVFRLQAAQRGAVLAPQAMAQVGDFFHGETQPLEHHIKIDPLTDQRPNPAVTGI